MNKKILALLLSLIMVLCQSTLCFGEDLIDAEEAVLLSDLAVVEGQDIVISGDTWSVFGTKKSTLTPNQDGSATFVPGGSGSSAGRSEYITVSTELPLKTYGEAVIRMKYTDVAGVTSRAEKDNGYYIPGVRVEFVCSVDGGMQTEVLTGKAVTGSESQTYTNDGYVDVTINIADIEGYANLTATTINIYPMYGFKSGTVDMESITIKYVEPAADDNTDGDNTDNDDAAQTLEYNFESQSDVEQWKPSSTNQIATSWVDGGYMKYVSTITSSSGWITNDVSFAGGLYNRMAVRAKIENYTRTTVSTALGKEPFMEMYYSCVYPGGEEKGARAGYSITQSYKATEGADGLFSGDWAEYEIDLTKLKDWSNVETITQIRLDLAKNAAGTVYVDYIRFYYEEPVVEPDPPAVDPDEPDNPDEPVEDPDKPEAPVIEGEQWYEMNFDTEADVAVWALNDKAQVQTSWVEGGYMKYVSTPITRNDGVKQSGWATATVDFDGNQYYKFKMRVKLENYERAFISNAAPHIEVYYSGKNAAGNKQDVSGSFRGAMSYQATEGEDGLFNSDWVEYEFDLANLGGWSTMTAITSFRIDFVKNAAGTVYVDYIKFLSLPAIETMTYNGTENADMTKVPVDAKTLEAYISQPLNTITKNDISVYEKSDDDERVEVEISKVSYTASTGKITAELAGEMLSNTDYVFEIKNTAMANSKQTLYKPVAKEFRTDSAAFETEVEAIDAGSAKVTYINTGSSSKNVVAIATAWDGTKYVGKVIAPTAATVGTTEVTLDYSKLGGSRVEIITWEFVKGSPKAYGKKVVEIVR
ncbi:MAG: hypothetical protein IJ460_05285 [Clostridia bacterium]|nr:hypothetical protein [Clostridia bacterium]